MRHRLVEEDDLDRVTSERVHEAAVILVERGALSDEEVPDLGCHKCMSVATVRRLARALGVRASELFA